MGGCTIIMLSACRGGSALRANAGFLHLFSWALAANIFVFSGTLSISAFALGHA
jgi:hypothetical protein